MEGLNGTFGALGGLKVDEGVSPVVLDLNVAFSESLEKSSNILVSCLRWEIVNEHRGFFFEIRNRLSHWAGLDLELVWIGFLLSVLISLGISRSVSFSHIFEFK